MWSGLSGRANCCQYRFHNFQSSLDISLCGLLALFVRLQEILVAILILKFKKMLTTFRNHAFILVMVISCVSGRDSSKNLKVLTT